MLGISVDVRHSTVEALGEGGIGGRRAMEIAAFERSGERHGARPAVEAAATPLVVGVPGVGGQNQQWVVASTRPWPQHEECVADRALRLPVPAPVRLGVGFGDQTDVIEARRPRWFGRDDEADRPIATACPGFVDIAELLRVLVGGPDARVAPHDVVPDTDSSHLDGKRIGPGRAVHGHVVPRHMAERPAVGLDVGPAGVVGMATRGKWVHDGSVEGPNSVTNDRNDWLASANSPTTFTLSVAPSSE